MITEPGIYPNIPEDVYHADTDLAAYLGRSLSVSGAKRILDLPAKFAYERDNGRPPKAAFDFGHAAHKLLLGVGNELEVVDAEDWRSKDARDQRDQARVNGKVPILQADFERAMDLVKATLAHPLAGAILSEGEPEQSMYWIDNATGITCRARADWLRDNAVVDVKTCADASPEGFAKACANFRYNMQADWYSEGVQVVTGEDERRPFIFIAIEKEPPHLVAVYQLDESALALGAQDNHDARRAYAEHESAGEWPGYPEHVETLTLPRYALNRLRSPL